MCEVYSSCTHEKKTPAATEDEKEERSVLRLLGVCHVGKEIASLVPAKYTIDLTILHASADALKIILWHQREPKRL